MQIGSSIATTVPEPTHITDFRRPVTFEVTAFDETEVWTVTVTYSVEANLTISPWSKRAYIIGEGNENTNLDIRFRRKGDEIWDMVYTDEITYEDGSFTALIRHLQPATTYEYEATIGSTVYDLAEFTTDDIPALPNSGFENWSLGSDGIWNVYSEGDEKFWDTGNRGSMTVGKNVTTYDESIYYSGRRSAKLASEYIIVRFAAGNLFAGEYVRTDGTDGVLDFGRPFTARPTALKGIFRYISTPISHTGDVLFEDAQIGMNDQAYIYIAVGDWSSPVEIKTKSSERKLFDINDEHIIAYQELVVDETVNSWTEFRLNLDYRSFTRKPIYLVIVATASKYGDYFTGGQGSTLWLDDFELVYE
ncbi:MAG: PCMD domain-containing protein [Tannerellaceae bacterium]|nr:PCMD domain-containing protein [Tannerellaceae bacterium]